MRNVSLAIGLLLLPAVAEAQVSVQIAAPAPVWLPPPPPHVYVRQRVRWHLRHHVPPVMVVPPRVVVVPPAPVYVPPPTVPPPPSVYIAPPPPPVYVEPPVAPLPPVPPPIVAPAPPVYYPPPTYYAPAPAPTVIVKPKPVVPQWRNKVGLGVRGSGAMTSEEVGSLGIGGELLFRVSPRIALELGAEYLRQMETAIPRRDIPVTFGMRLHIGRPDWVVSPYFVLATGVDYAVRDLPLGREDAALYVVQQFGGGLEIRLGHRVGITADVRLDGKIRLNDVDPAVRSFKSVNGQAVAPLNHELAGILRLGVAVYF